MQRAIIMQHLNVLGEHRGDFRHPVMRPLQ
jgi:hypothetical protein